MAPVSEAANGICYAVMGYFSNAVLDIEPLVGVMPRTIAAALNRKAPYFVPLTLNLGLKTVYPVRSK